MTSLPEAARLALGALENAATVMKQHGILPTATERAAASLAGAQWRERALKLWALLDDIDTADDVAKGDDAAFRRIAQAAQQRRHGVLSGDEWQAAGGPSTPVEQIIIDARKS